ncbi:MAG: hypothetical protein SangKO_031850 [Sandaracinaceae bacterium]
MTIPRTLERFSATRPITTMEEALRALEARGDGHVLDVLPGSPVGLAAIRDAGFTTVPGSVTGGAIRLQRARPRGGRYYAEPWADHDPAHGWSLWVGGLAGSSHPDPTPAPPGPVTTADFSGGQGSTPTVETSAAGAVDAPAKTEQPSPAARKQGLSFGLAAVAVGLGLLAATRGGKG